jgi:hypothetical protein
MVSDSRVDVSRDRCDVGADDEHKKCKCKSYA